MIPNKASKYHYSEKTTIQYKANSAWQKKTLKRRKSFYNVTIIVYIMPTLTR